MTHKAIFESMTDVVLKALVARGFLPYLNCGALGLAFVASISNDHWFIWLFVAFTVFALLLLLGGLVSPASTEFWDHVVKLIFVKTLNPN